MSGEIGLGRTEGDVFRYGDQPMTAIPDGERWNHNVHYHQVVLRSVPPNAEKALDVGCGEGLLARRLRERVGTVVGIDRDEASIRVACEQRSDGIEFVIGDFLTHPFAPESFDFVVAVASLHHMDVHLALRRMRSVLRPGGRLTVVGLARSRAPFDLPFDLAGVVAHRMHKRAKQEWDDGAPRVWPPALTFGQNRRIALRELQGARYRRRLLWRYTLIWTKPNVNSSPR